LSSEECFNAIIQALTDCAAVTKEKFKEALKLWRPYFYRDTITERDIEELDKIL
jgi:hypothetical protein